MKHQESANSKFHGRCLRMSLAAFVLAGLVSNTGVGAAPAAAEKLNPYLTAQHINAFFEQTWVNEQVHPAPPATHAEFLRRVSLDLSGKIPAVYDARSFIDDRGLEKRERLVDLLLDRASFATHFANTWRKLMLPGVENNLQTRLLVPQFEDWLRLRFVTDTPYDRIAQEVLTAPLDGNPAFDPRRRPEPSPGLFYLVNERKPENLAASTARIFLGVQVQCAQCHKHPFADWTREQFWSFAAFFGEASRNGREQGDDKPVALDGKSIRIPDMDAVVPAVFLDGTRPTWQDEMTGRSTLTQWIVARSNPYFARATVNRLWFHFFGRGLVDPVDNIDPANQPSQPEVLDLLARQFVLHDFDIKFLVRAITATRVYQLSSQTTDASQQEVRFFARMPLRSMTAEQLFDSLVEATGYIVEEPNNNRRALTNPANVKQQFLSKFSDSGSTPTDYQASILQALTLMNGTMMADVTSLERSQTLRAILESPFFQTTDRIEALFLATLSRRPTAGEREQVGRHLQLAESEPQRKQAYADVYWALLNSVEFALVP